MPMKLPLFNQPKGTMTLCTLCRRSYTWIVRDGECGAIKQHDRETCPIKPASIKSEGA